MQIFLERMQLEQEGRFSSHLIRLCLQLLHPVLTLGLLVRARFGFCALSLALSTRLDAGGGRPPLIKSEMGVMVRIS